MTECVFPSKTCVQCNNEFVPTSGNQHRCVDCRVTKPKSETPKVSVVKKGPHVVPIHIRLIISVEVQ
jgi:hypothetical protein